MLRVWLFIAVTLAACPALAGATAWQLIAPGVRARLISADRIDNGTTLAGLELDMPANTKTYWRIPGEAGIPARFDFSTSTGVGDTMILWPYPKVDVSEGVLDYDYYGPLVLPVRVAVSGAAATLNANVAMGICSDICVPVQASFSLPMQLDKPDAAQSIRLDQALAQVPIDWDQPQPAFGQVTATADGIRIADPAPAVDPVSIIADLGDPALLFDTPQKSPDGRSLTLKLLDEAGAKGLEGRSVQLTFMTAEGPYVVTRQIGAAQ